MSSNRLLKKTALDGFESVKSSDPKTARFFRITIPEPGRYILNVGPGDHTIQRWELDKDQLRGLVLDALPELL